jgi:DNA-binding NarL/FixJ family response regulator
MKKRIKLLLVDDHPVVRKGIASCLAQHDHLQVIGEAADGRDALRKARELSPDIVLMDIDMPHMNGLAVTDLLRKDMPKIKVLILSMHSNTDYVLRIIQSGARGYVLKDAPTDELVQARSTRSTVAKRSSARSRPLGAQSRQRHRHHQRPGRPTPPTANAKCSSTSPMASAIRRSPANSASASARSKPHRERIMRKLNIHVAGLTKFAISQGLVSLNG